MATAMAWSRRRMCSLITAMVTAEKEWYRQPMSIMMGVTATGILQQGSLRTRHTRVGRKRQVQAILTKQIAAVKETGPIKPQRSWQMLKHLKQ